MARVCEDGLLHWSGQVGFTFKNGRRLKRRCGNAMPAKPFFLVDCPCLALEPCRSDIITLYVYQMAEESAGEAEGATYEEESWRRLNIRKMYQHKFYKTQNADGSQPSFHSKRQV